MGLKTLNRIHLASIVSMSDDGGSTGRLRNSFGVLPPGDVRRSLVALSTAPKLMNELLAYRFDRGESLEGHNVGNLFLTALSEISGSMQQAVRDASEILNIRGIVMPITTTLNKLVAEFENGTKIKGESAIDVPKKRDYRLHIKKLWQEPEAHATPEVISVIHNSEFITLGPGDLYTSVLSNLTVKGIPEAIRETGGKRIYICNVMTKPGETHGMVVEDHVQEVIRYLGGDFLDYIVVSKTPIPRLMISSYKKERQAPVKIRNRQRLKNITQAKIIEADLSTLGDYFRHDPHKLASVLGEIFHPKGKPKTPRARKGPLKHLKRLKKDLKKRSPKKKLKVR